MNWYSIPDTLWDENRSPFWPVLLLFISVLLACLLGIWSRPVGFLASVWPANAIMLGLLLRYPAAARYGGWIAGAAAFMLADLLTESGVFKAAILNSANLVSIAVAYLLLSRKDSNVINLRQPQAMLQICLAAVLGGAAAGIIGGFANPILFNASIVNGFLLWWVTEVVNYIAILPILLTLPTISLSSLNPTQRKWHIRRNDLLPVTALIASCLLAVYIGGEGAIAFPALPLLWCAVVYPVFLTTLLTLLCSLFTLLVIFNGQFSIYRIDVNETALISIRLGIAVVAISPIMLAIITRNRNELLSRLRYMSSHDTLTGVGNRAAFYSEAAEILAERNQPHAFMMLDLDHFKAINDNYGHAAGDSVLRETARRIVECLRPTDRMARMGGEEFAVALRNCPPQSAQMVAERIRAAIADWPFVLSDGQHISVTTSIGLMLTIPAQTHDIDALLAAADHALYRSKANGRNRVELANPQ